MHLRDVTIVMATSVLPSHPDTRIIDETVAAIRKHFPENEIIMQIDGLREEQRDRKKDYDEYIKNQKDIKSLSGGRKTRNKYNHKKQTKRNKKKQTE